jgi:hypothetical protein
MLYVYIVFVLYVCVLDVEYVSAIGLVVKYLVAIEMPRVRFPDGAFFCSFDCTGALTMSHL